MSEVAADAGGAEGRPANLLDSSGFGDA